jgi:hypothetical protein
VTSDAKWAVACSAITFALTSIMVLMQLHPVSAVLVTNNKLEGVICIILVAFWSGIVSIVSDAENNLAVRSSNNNECNNTVLNGNLYYFSWASFVTSISLLVSYLRSVFGVDLLSAASNRGRRLDLWGGMLACSLVVMGSSANIFQIDCKPVIVQELEVYCTRCKFGISVGTIGSFFAIVVVGMKLVTAAAPFVFEGFLSLILAILNACGVAFITVRLVAYVCVSLARFLQSAWARKKSIPKVYIYVCSLACYFFVLLCILPVRRWTWLGNVSFQSLTFNHDYSSMAGSAARKTDTLFLRPSLDFVCILSLCVCLCVSRGNLYYFSWASFLVSVSILASCYEDLTGGSVAQQANDSDAEKAANGEIQIESLPPGSDQEY